MDQTRAWLQGALANSKYKYQDRVFRDVDATINLYKTLSPKSEPYTYDNGQCQLLICLHGTIPITYRSSPYNIPVAFWIPTDYPKGPPIVFVVPTPNMLVKAGQNVDNSGRCYHPYLHHWPSRSEESNILGLCSILQKIFGQDPPLYTKPTINQNLVPQPAPERPHNLNQNRMASPVIGPFRSKSPTPPPLPPPPPYQWKGEPKFNQSTINNLQPGAFHDTDLELSKTQVNKEIPGGGRHPPISARYSNLSHSAQSSSPPLSILDIPSPPINNTHTLVRNIDNQDPESIQLQIEIYEKIERRWSSYHEQASVEINKMMTFSEQLSGSEAQVEEEKQKLLELQRLIKEKSDFLKMKSAEIDRLVDQATNMPEVSVDDVLCGTTIVYNQLFELVAEDNATEDTIYYLGRALNTERLDLQTFMKSIRTLAREQFMRRALIQKVRKQAGLDP